MAIHNPEGVDRAMRGMLLGDYLGGGISRSVYVYEPDHTKVIKIMDKESAYFQNQMEYEYWEKLGSNKEARKWLAPCHSISECGLILIQDRTTPLAEYTKLPVKVPVFLRDTHKANFGMLKGKIVCHDYGLLNATFSMRLRKANW